MLFEGVEDVFEEEVELPAPRQPARRQPSVGGHQKHCPGVEVQQLGHLSGRQDRWVLLAYLSEAIFLRGGRHQGSVEPTYSKLP